MIWTFFSSLNSYVLVWSIFAIFISKFKVLLAYLELSIQRMIALKWVHQSCACTPLAILAPNVGPTSPSVSTITATVAVWLATCVTAAWIVLILPFQLVFYTIACLFSGVTMFAYL